MPSALYPQAKFDPIPPDLDLSALVEKTPNFDYVIRISTDQVQELGFEEFEKLVLLHVIVGGKPLVVEGWNKSLPPWLFSSSWMVDHVGRKQEVVRDIVNAVDIPMTIGHYLGAMNKLGKQWTSANYRDSRRQRLYLKDIDCPEPWHQHLQTIIPQSLFYLNDCVAEKGGPGAFHERNIYGQLVLDKGVGPAGDLMSSLPPEMRAENMMCYIGHEGTYTPAHREMCASLGQNIMVETSRTGNGEKAGSSIWFMTESKDREVVSEYFLSVLGHDIEVESHFAQINAWKKAPFPVYIVEQKLGDFILIPPLAPHQVWNRGTRTIKVAWNRTTVETLELALHEALPRARMVCRDEQYKNKAIIYYSLLRYYDQLKRVEQAEGSSWYGHDKDSIRNSTGVKQLKRDFKRLFALYTEVLVGEMFSKDLPKEKHVEFLPFDGNITCSYCRCNIFNRFLTCKACIGEGEVTGEDDTYDICMECYAMGRSCFCVSNLTWVEQWQWAVLTRGYDEWRAMVIANDGFNDSSSPPSTLDLARTLYAKKPVAQICQEQLKCRPWRDISKPIQEEHSPPESELEPEVNDEGRVKQRKKGTKWKSRWKTQNKACHICQHRELKWKLAFCTTCPNAYCFGTLWRAFDLKPQTVMEDPNWQCPKCLKICSCGRCRRDPSQHAYWPKGTLLGHDTRRVADPRSVESLVDFSRTNLNWLRNEGNDDSQTLRMQRLLEKAQNEKARDEALKKGLIIEEDTEQNSVQNSLDVDSANDMAIDPQLCGYESNKANEMGDLDVNYLSDQSTITHAHIPRCNRHEDTAPDTEIQAIADGNCARGEFCQAQGKHSAGSTFHTGYNAREAAMFVRESFNPNPLAPLGNRVAGVDYSQQINNTDKILFDHPNTSIPTGKGSTFAYPRPPKRPLVSESGIKEMESISLSNGGDIDDAAQLSRAQEQKLADAENHGRYFPALSELDDGQGSMARLLMIKSKESLHHLQELDEGQLRLRHNPASPNRSTAGQQHYPQRVANTIVVTSDIQENVAQSIYQEDSDNNSLTLTNRAIQKLTVPPIFPKTAADDKFQENEKKCDSPFKILSELDKKSPNNKIPSNRSGANCPSSTSTQKEVMESEQVSQQSSSHGQKSPQSTVSESKQSVIDLETVHIQLSDSTNTPQQFINVLDRSTTKPTPLSKGRPADKEVNLIGKDHIPVSTAPAILTKSRRAIISKPLSKDYLIAKEAAFRLVEVGFEKEGANKRHTQKASLLKGHTSPKHITSFPSMSKARPTDNKSLPKALPGRLMSMAEQQALKGKPFKIVAAKSAPISRPANAPTTAPGSTVSSKNLMLIACRNLGNNSHDSTTDGQSSDDEPTQAACPVAKKPRIEVLATSGKTIFNPATGIHEMVRPRKRQ